MRDLPELFGGRGEPGQCAPRTFGTGVMDDHEIGVRVREVFDFRVAAIVRDLQLRELPSRSTDGFYQRQAVYGQMGRVDLDAPWEKTDKADELR